MWAYDFVQIRTRDGRAVRLLTVIDEYTRECLAIRAGHSIRSSDVIETLAELMQPEECRSISARTTGPSSLPRQSGSGSGRWEQGRYTSSPGPRGRTGTWRASTATEGRVAGSGGLPLLEAQVLTEQYRLTYNRIRPTAPWATGHRLRNHSCPRTLSQSWSD